MKKLIGMVAFVLEQNIKHNGEYEGEEMVNLLIKLYGNTVNYANFLSRQPQLSDFVPCGEDGLPLDKNMVFADKDKDYAIESEKFDVYQKALDKVLFKGFEIVEYAHNVEFVKAIVCPNNVTHIAWYSKITCSWHLSKGIKTLESLTHYNLELSEKLIKDLEI